MDLAQDHMQWQVLELVALNIQAVLPQSTVIILFTSVYLVSLLIMTWFMQLDKKQVFESQETFYMTVFTAHCSH
jgi:hypothetical protein